MPIETVIFLILGIITFTLFAMNVFLIWRSFVISRRFDDLLEKGKIKGFKDVLIKQKEKNSELEEKIKQAILKIKNLEGISQKTIQKTGIIRFNPFNNMGGNQSFVIALLDDKNNGFVVSSLFVKEGNRVYAKAIKQGKSDHKLSKEETEAITKAING